MTVSLFAVLAAPFLLQATADVDVGAQTGAEAPSIEATLPKVTSLDQLPIEQAASMRCSVAFALVTRWQNQGDPRGANYPDLEADGGREFFVRSLSPLMRDRGMSGTEVQTMILREVQELEQIDNGAQAQSMMPACLLMKQSAGL
ncbi:MAG: hypothetical protein ABJN35_14305 [Erythrobacter sp.]